MIRIINIPNAAVPPAQQTDQVQARPGTATTEPSGPVSDQVEISDEGLALSRAVDHSTHRIMRIAAIRDEIRSGEYETPERIEGTVDRLLRVLSS